MESASDFTVMQKNDVASPVSQKDDTQDELSELNVIVKILLGFAIVISLIAISFLVWFVAIRDTWEIDNTDRLSFKLSEADRLQQSDPFAAYKIYDEVLKETSQHNIRDERFSQKLVSARKSLDALLPRVEDKIRAEEAEKQRQAEEKSRFDAEEKKHIAREEEKKSASEVAKIIAAEKLRAEEKRRKEAALAYRDVPQSARNALNAVKRLEAKIEVGVNYMDYSRAVGETWGEVKIFIESPDGKSLPEYSLLLIKAIEDYKSALKVWHSKIEFSALAKKHEIEIDTLLQHCWSRAGLWLLLAEELIAIPFNAKCVEINLEKVQIILEKISNDIDQDFDVKLHRILGS